MFHRMLPLLCLSLLAAAPLPANAQDAAPTLRTSTRIVPFDVVVTDSRGNAVHHLPPSDFLIFQDKQPQTIAHFQEFAAPAAAAPLPTPANMPPGVFSNMVALPADAPLNVLLLDNLNTPTADQGNLRRQLKTFLKTMQPNARVAIFALGNGLIFLQGFTTDPRVLLAALDGAKIRPSPLRDDSFAQHSQTKFSPDGPTSAEIHRLDETLDARLTTNRTEIRVRSSMNALSQIARFLAGFPGRKNLVWFSGSFPTSTLPDATLLNPFDAQLDLGPEMRQMVQLMTRAQVAVYPVNARGLFNAPGANAANSNQDYLLDPSQGPQQQGRFTLDQQKFERETTEENGTMLQMANATGGHAFLNTNDLTTAARNAIAEGANYYSIEYKPPPAPADGRFHTISVQLQHPGYHLSYRRGYYADPIPTPAPASGSKIATNQASPAPPKAGPTAFQLAMLHGAPESTEINFRQRITPLGTVPGGSETATLASGETATAKAKPPFRTMEITYAIDPSTLVSRADAKHPLHLQATAIVYNAAGDVCTYGAVELQTEIAPEKLAAFLHSGIQMHQRISIPAQGDFYLRTSVEDSQHGRLGSMEVPTALFTTLPAVQLNALKP